MNFNIKTLTQNIRFYILLSTVILSLSIYLWAKINFQIEQFQIIRLTQIYSLLAILYLYIALLAEPFCYTFKSFQYKDLYLDARKAIVASVFYFAFLHTCLAFFGQLGGFDGLGFLGNRYLIPIILSFTALIILLLISITSLDFIGKKFTPTIRRIFHDLVYIAGILILIHAMMLGTHFSDLVDFIPQLVFVGLGFLLFLESLRIDSWVKERFNMTSQFGYGTVIVLGIILTGLLYFFLPIPGGNGITFGIHSQHIQLAKEAQQGTTGAGDNPALAKIPGLQGDRTKRFSVDFEIPTDIQANTDTTLSFKAVDASSGDQIFLFNKVYGKIVHLIIVDSELKYFSHIHPEFKDGQFTITTQFPKDGQYHLYTDFQPFGAIEQRIATTLNVGNFEKTKLSTDKPDSKLTKTFGDYEITLKYPKPLISDQISIGKQILGFTLKDAKTKENITNLKPYLDAFGHMVMINQKTFDYIHVHPNDLRVPKPDQNGGPTVEFMPLGLYGPIKPGVYKVFAQFNPNNNLMVSDFTVKIE